MFYSFGPDGMEEPLSKRKKRALREILASIST